AGGGGSSVGAASVSGSSSSWTGVRDAGPSSSLRQSTSQVGVGQSGAEDGSSPGGVRRTLTEAEKKALRRKLEKLRKQREGQGNY
ncbi:MAG TPA: hypothetical protein PLQ00_13455, partial [Thermoguttaceae bacterium]|nr:hypothetical protein [Thermoguttaceae bacterium]